jgi:hypothetical protein
VTEERIIKYYIKSYETMLTKIIPACSNLKGSLVQQTCIIIDLKGVRILDMKRLYKFMKIAASVAQDNYPELLGKMFIVNAPLLFSVI